MRPDEYLVQGSIGMTRGSILRIEDGCDILIHVWEGSLWLTQEGDPRDRYVGAGRWFRLDRNGTAVAYAMRRAVVTLTAPAAAKPSLGARLRRFWAGRFAPHARPTTASL